MKHFNMEITQDHLGVRRTEKVLEILLFEKALLCHGEGGEER